MTDDFCYLNARIRPRRGELLHEGFFDEALNLSFRELVKVLDESIYGEDLNGDTLADVDRAVQVHLARTVGDLPRLVGGEARDAVRLLLLQSDLSNVKTLLRERAERRPAEEIMGHLAGGTIPQSLYAAMAEAPDAASLAQVLSLPGHPIASALREAVREAKGPLETEMILDKVFYRALFTQARQLDEPALAGFVAFEIDAANLATGFKLFTLAFEGQPERFFLTGGVRVAPSLFQRLAVGEVTALEELGGTEFHRVAEVRDLAALERGLRCTLLDRARACGWDALGAGMVIDYVRRKQWEAGRVRLIARRAWYELPRASIEKEVFCT